MSDQSERSPGLATLAIRTGHQRTGEGEHSEPLFATSSYVFGSAEEAAVRTMRSGYPGHEEGGVV